MVNNANPRGKMIIYKPNGAPMELPWQPGMPESVFIPPEIKAPDAPSWQKWIMPVSLFTGGYAVYKQLKDLKKPVSYEERNLSKIDNLHDIIRLGESYLQKRITKLIEVPKPKMPRIRIDPGIFETLKRNTVDATRKIGHTLPVIAGLGIGGIYYAGYRNKKLKKGRTNKIKKVKLADNYKPELHDLSTGEKEKLKYLAGASVTGGLLGGSLEAYLQRFPIVRKDNVDLGKEIAFRHYSKSALKYWHKNKVEFAKEVKNQRNKYVDSMLNKVVDRVNRKQKRFSKSTVMIKHPGIHTSYGYKTPESVLGVKRVNKIRKKYTRIFNKRISTGVIGDQIKRRIGEGFGASPSGNLFSSGKSGNALLNNIVERASKAGKISAVAVPILAIAGGALIGSNTAKGAAGSIIDPMFTVRKKAHDLKRLKKRERRRKLSDYICFNEKPHKKRKTSKDVMYERMMTASTLGTSIPFIHARIHPESYSKIITGISPDSIKKTKLKTKDRLHRYNLAFKNKYQTEFAKYLKSQIEAESKIKGVDIRKRIPEIYRSSRSAFDKAVKSSEQLSKYKRGLENVMKGGKQQLFKGALRTSLKRTIAYPLIAGGILATAAGVHHKLTYGKKGHKRGVW